MNDESRMMKLLEDAAADARKAAEASRESTKEAKSASTNSALALKETQRMGLRMTTLEKDVEHIRGRVTVLEGHDVGSARSLAEEAKRAAEEAKRISQAEGLEVDAHKAETLIQLTRLEKALVESEKSLEEARREFRAQKKSRRRLDLTSLGAFISSLAGVVLAVVYAVRSPVPQAHAGAAPNFSTLDAPAPPPAPRVDFDAGAKQP